MFKLENIVRENIRHLTPYSSARKEFGGPAEIFLDANENSFGSPIAVQYHRYPDPLQVEIKSKIAVLQDVNDFQIFIGNGSDEAIDLLFRIFSEPKRDNVLICPPTYGMYQVSAEINDVAIKRVPLTADFQLDVKGIKAAIDENTKLIFICSPNNPTGNSVDRSEILDLAREFHGILVVDEAYVHFSREDSLISQIKNIPNLVVLQTFSKAWGLAGLRVGLAFAQEPLIELFNKVKPPYNISGIVQKTLLTALANTEKVETNILEIVAEREWLIRELGRIRAIEKIFPTDANFVLVKTENADEMYRFLLEGRVVVRNRNNVELCGGCLRITVGKRAENERLLALLSAYGR